MTPLPDIRPLPRDGVWHVYIHFPYCLHRCAYCDFATAVARDIPREAYLQAILAELTARTAELPQAPIASVFFGGGTPSLWGAKPVGQVLQWLDRWSGIPAGAEVTLEANPGAVEAVALYDYAAAGINRVSVGIQALDDRRLRALDRLHDAAGARRTLDTLAKLLQGGQLRSASADLMFGAPGQTAADLAADITEILDRGLPHLSAYSLTVEPETPLHERVARGLQPPPDDGLQADMLAAMPDLVAPWGLQRYEVSNFARPGHESRHNLAYWTGKHYLAAGLGAHGFLPAAQLAGERYGNERAHKLWWSRTERGEVAESFREAITATDHLTERLLTGLRLREGLNLTALRRDVGEDLVEVLEQRVRSRPDLPVHLTPERLVLTNAGWPWLDRVVRDLA